MKTRLRWRGWAESSSSGATIAVCPEGRRIINLPSDVIPMTRVRTDPRRPRDALSGPWPALACLDLDVADFCLVCELDWLTVFGGRSASVRATAFASTCAPELSGVAPAAF